LAKREAKTPVLVLFDKGRRGALVVAHQDDLAIVAAELARPDQADLNEGTYLG
jgi:hypothetical protein